MSRGIFDRDTDDDSSSLDSEKANSANRRIPKHNQSSHTLSQYSLSGYEFTMENKGKGVKNMLANNKRNYR
jgi:hypothetical protein